MKTPIIFAATLAIAAAGILLLPAAASAVTLGQINTFDTNLEGWFGGQGPTPTFISTGGPAGAGDGYMQWSSEQNPIGGKNETGWTGDYLGEGIDLIEFDINNFGAGGIPKILEMRVVVFHSSDLLAWTNTVAVPVPAVSGWQHIQVSIAPADMTQVLFGPDIDPFNTPEFALADGGRLLIRHDPFDASEIGSNPLGNVGFLGIPYLLGIDNIEASQAVIPEPSRAVLLLVSVAAIGLMRRRAA